MSNQEEFYELLDKYNNAIEPLENWTTADLVKMIDAIDAELQNRAPPDSEYPSPMTGEAAATYGVSDDDY